MSNATRQPIARRQRLCSLRVNLVDILQIAFLQLRRRRHLELYACQRVTKGYASYVGASEGINWEAQRRPHDFQRLLQKWGAASYMAAEAQLDRKWRGSGFDP
jgi:hypothetical protein